MQQSHGLFAIAKLLVYIYTGIICLIASDCLSPGYDTDIVSQLVDVNYMTVQFFFTLFHYPIYFRFHVPSSPRKRQQICADACERFHGGRA